MAVNESPQIALDRFMFVYQSLNKNNLNRLSSVYGDDIVFMDPAHTIKGWDQLYAYFVSLYSNVKSCEFTIHHSAINGDTAFLNWTMSFAHPKLAAGKMRQLSGCTRLKIKDGKVVEHQDYFDLGAMIYEAVPLLGRIVKKIKAAFGQA